MKRHYSIGVDADVWDPHERRSRLRDEMLKGAIPATVWQTSDRHISVVVPTRRRQWTSVRASFSRRQDEFALCRTKRSAIVPLGTFRTPWKSWWR